MEKEKAIEVVGKMPDNFELDELFERLIFVEKVEEGLRQIDEGKGIPHEEVKKIIAKWLK